MKSIQATKTQRNLRVAFVGESEAKNKYSYFAQIAKNQGEDEIAEVFLKTAKNEKVHAKLWAELLGIFSSDTKENLKSAIERENYEWTSLYDLFAKEAREEGFDEIANKFESVANIERAHELKFQKLLDKLLNAQANEIQQEKENIISWQCNACGKIFVAIEPPELCDLCTGELLYIKKVL